MPGTVATAAATDTRDGTALACAGSTRGAPAEHSASPNSRVSGDGRAEPAAQAHSPKTGPSHTAARNQRPTSCCTASSPNPRR